MQDDDFQEVEPEEFSSTMRIDIPPDLLKGAGQKKTAPSKPEPTQKRRRTIRIPKKTTVEVEAPKSKYEQLLQSIYDAAIITDLSGRILDTNYRAEEFLIYSKEELAAKHILEVISGADEAMLESIKESLQNDRFVLIEAFCERSDQSLFAAEISVNRLKAEETLLCFFMRDITVRKETEDMLKTSHKAITNAWNGIAVADLEGRVVFVNPAVLRIWGFTQEKELLGRDFRDLWVERSEAEEILKAITEGQEKWEGQMRIRRHDGEEVPVQVSAAGNRDADDELVGMVLSFLDLSDRERAESAMREAEAHKAMLATLGTACHHLGQPATVIITNMKMMERFSDSIEDEGVRDMIRMNSEAADSLQEVLHKLNQATVYITTDYLENEDYEESAANKLLDLDID